MPQEALHVMLTAALERLRAEQLANADAAELPSDSALRLMIEAALDSLRDRLEHDPAWVEDALKDIVSDQKRSAD